MLFDKMRLSLMSILVLLVFFFSSSSFSSDVKYRDGGLIFEIKFDYIVKIYDMPIEHLTVTRVDPYKLDLYALSCDFMNNQSESIEFLKNLSGLVFQRTGHKEIDFEYRFGLFFILNGNFEKLYIQNNKYENDDYVYAYYRGFVYKVNNKIIDFQRKFINSFSENKCKK